MTDAFETHPCPVPVPFSDTMQEAAPPMALNEMGTDTNTPTDGGSKE